MFFISQEVTFLITGASEFLENPEMPHSSGDPAGPYAGHRSGKVVTLPC